MEGVIGQPESTVISRFLGRWPNDSMILGDNNGWPERRRVASAALAKEGRQSGAGGKYSEDIFSRAIAKTQAVVDETGTERGTGDDGERRTGLYTPRTR